VNLKINDVLRSNSKKYTKEYPKQEKQIQCG